MRRVRRGGRTASGERRRADPIRGWLGHRRCAGWRERGGSQIATQEPIRRHLSDVDSRPAVDREVGDGAVQPDRDRSVDEHAPRAGVKSYSWSSGRTRSTNRLARRADRSSSSAMKVLPRRSRVCSARTCPTRQRRRRNRDGGEQHTQRPRMRSIDKAQRFRAALHAYMIGYAREDGDAPGRSR